MKWLIVVVVVLFVLIVVPLALGSLLPVGHMASKSRLIAAPPEAVWAVIRDVAQAPSWREGVSKIELLPDANGHPQFRETSRFGEVTFEILESVPPKRFVTRIGGGEKSFGGTWTYELVPEGAGTRVTVTEHGEVYNPLFRFMSRYIFGQEGSLNAYLGSLAKKFGEAPR